MKKSNAISEAGYVRDKDSSQLEFSEMNITVLHVAIVTHAVIALGKLS